MDGLRVEWRRGPWLVHAAAGLEPIILFQWVGWGRLLGRAWVDVLRAKGLRLDLADDNLDMPVEVAAAIGPEDLDHVLGWQSARDHGLGPAWRVVNVWDPANVCGTPCTTVLGTRQRNGGSWWRVILCGPSPRPRGVHVDQRGVDAPAIVVRPWGRERLERA
jgi:hypothetical protein